MRLHMHNTGKKRAEEIRVDTIDLDIATDDPRRRTIIVPQSDEAPGCRFIGGIAEHGRGAWRAEEAEFHGAGLEQEIAPSEWLRFVAPEAQPAVTFGSNGEISHVKCREVDTPAATATDLRHQHSAWPQKGYNLRKWVIHGRLIR
jgi:hypothetical protein